MNRIRHAEAPDDARTRLLHTALRLFAERGYSKTSTRELAEAAQVNVASISYYFGDKAGLYRAAFIEPVCGDEAEDIARLRAPGLDLPSRLRTFFDGFLHPLRLGEMTQHFMKLRFREMLEPTGLVTEELACEMQPLHHALLDVLGAHLGLLEPDLELQRLAFCITGLGVHVYVGHDHAQQLAPDLNQHADSVDLWAERLSGYALAMVQAEAARRALNLKGNAL